jgi:hypothetical protein
MITGDRRHVKVSGFVFEHAVGCPRYRLVVDRSRLGTGVFLLELQAEDHVATRKLIRD